MIFSGAMIGNDMPSPKPKPKVPPTEHDAFASVRVVGIRVILGIVVFVAVGNFIDDVVFGDLYHPDATLYAWITGLAVTFITGVSLQNIVQAHHLRQDDDDDDDR